jgi:hypothetical protein
LDTKKSMNVLRVRQADQSGDDDAIGLVVVDAEEKGK